MPDVTMKSVSYQSMVSLRVARSQAAEAIGRLGLAKPLSRTAEELASAWMGPAHWLLISNPERADDLIRRVADSLDGLLYQAVSSSDAFAVTALDGLLSRHVLAAGCALDFRPDNFPPGSCHRTRFAQVPVAICAQHENSFELICERSCRDYLASWLADTIAQTLRAGCNAHWR